MNHMRGITTPKKHKECVTQVRNDFLRLESLLPTTSFVWHWIKRHSTENSREARVNECFRFSLALNSHR